jgi:hypothetical protein
MTVQREVSSELFALLEPSTTITACSASDTLSSMLSNVEEDTIQELLNKTPSSGLLASSGLNLHASVAGKSNYWQLPNRCSYPGCGAPICLAPLDCSTPNCTGKVHPFCQVYAGASGCTMFSQPSKVVGTLPDGYHKSNPLPQVPTKQSVLTSKVCLPPYFRLPIGIPTLRKIVGPTIARA